MARTQKTDKAVQPEVTKWLTKIGQYERDFKAWEGRSEKLLKLYRDDRGINARKEQVKFNILWSNVQTTMPAIFPKIPKADVSRRFRDKDPIARVASLVLERGLQFELEHYSDFKATARACLFDRLTGGRGVAWVRYEPHIQAVQSDEPIEGLEVTEDVPDNPALEEISLERAPVDYVHWRDFGHVVARSWEEVPTIWRKVYMTREELVERFGEEIGNRVPLDSNPEMSNNSKASTNTSFSLALIYEIWDKPSRKAIWLAKSLGEIIDEKDDPLELENFWPCPKPLFSTITNDSLIPIPDYALYQDQAEELNLLSERIDGLVDALRVRGCYDASIPELSRLFKEGQNGDLIPVKNWAAFAEKQGLAGGISLVDIKPIAEALLTAYQAFEQIKNQIYEITGMADILRGATQPTETATAQQIKGQYASVRLKTMQREFVEFVTEIIQIKAQIMSRFYQPETLAKISAAQQLAPNDAAVFPRAVELLRNEPLKAFRIEVSSDSMMELDEIQEKTDRMEFLKTVGGYLEQAVPMAENNPLIAPLIMDMLQFGAEAFRAGKTLEGEIASLADEVKQRAQQPQNPQPNPEMMKIQAQSNASMQEMQMKFQLEQRKLQMQMQLEQHKQEMQAQQIAHQNTLEAQRSALEAQNEARLRQLEMAQEERMKAIQAQLEILLGRMNNQAKLEIAQIQAASDLQQPQIMAAQVAQPE